MATSQFDPRVVAHADAALAEGLKAAAPALARHAARCVEGAGNASREIVGQLAWKDRAAALDLVAALAASDCARDAVAPLRRPLEAACDVVRVPHSGTQSGYVGQLKHLLPALVDALGARRGVDSVTGFEMPPRRAL